MNPQTTTNFIFRLSKWDPATGGVTVSSEFAFGPFPVDSGYAYNGYGAQLWRIRLTDGARELLDETIAPRQALAVNDTDAFWRDDAGVVWSINK
jgi:hypothetical protein